MTRVLVWSAAILAVAFSGSASIARTAPHDFEVPAVHAPALPWSSVHDWNGQRYDVPPELVRRPGVLINGLGAQAEQFE